MFLRNKTTKSYEQTDISKDFELIQSISQKYKLSSHSRKVTIVSKRRKTFNTIIYEINANERLLIGKSYLFKSKELLANEFNALLKFQNTLFGRKFCLPKPVDYYPDLGILVMSKIEGINVRELLQKPNKLPSFLDIKKIIKICSECLSIFHKSSYLGLKIKNISGVSIAFSQSYTDFDPSNMILVSNKDERLGIIDLPEQVVIDPIHRDIGTFFFGLAKSRMFLPYLLKWNLKFIINLQNIFFTNYFSYINLVPTTFDYKLARFFEYSYGKKVLKRYIRLHRLLEYSYFSPLINSYLFLIKKKFLLNFDIAKFQDLTKNMEAAS